MAASVLRQWVRVQLLDTGKYVNNCKLGPIKKNDSFFGEILEKNNVVSIDFLT